MRKIILRPHERSLGPAPECSQERRRNADHETEACVAINRGCPPGLHAPQHRANALPLPRSMATANSTTRALSRTVSPLRAPPF